MSEMNGKYKQIMQEIEENVKDPETLEFIKEKFAEMSMLFVDMLDRVTKLTDNKVQEIEEKQMEILNRINSVQSAVDGIEKDIYEDDENYEFEIVCPYCDYEFVSSIEGKDEITCPNCNNVIELDWNEDEEEGCCLGHCHSCHGCEEDELDDDENDEDEDM